MQEKIKVYISKDVYQTLMKDAELFEFYKKDHSVNRNAFLNQLVTNYLDEYQAMNTKNYNAIQKVLKEETSVPGKYMDDVTHHILNQLHLGPSNYRSLKDDVTLSFKPNKSLDNTMVYIQEQLLNQQSMSHFFRSLFSSYCLMPRNKRELILFSRQYETISKAISEKKRIYFTNTDASQTHTISPASICSSKEELFNYVIGQEGEFTCSFRLSRIGQVQIMDQHCVFLDSTKSLLKKMKEYGPQFAYGKYNQMEEIKIWLSDLGKKKFEKMYTQRPQPSQINADIYTFHCTRAQIILYFQKFGRDAVVLSPSDLRDECIGFYTKASSTYRKHTKP